MDTIKIGSIAATSVPDGPSRSAKAESGGGAFAASLKDAISQVNDAQLQANHAVDALMTGQSENIHQTMLALQKADVSFQLMMQVRNKLVSAYEEIQRIQI